MSSSSSSPPRYPHCQARTPLRPAYIAEATVPEYLHYLTLRITPSAATAADSVIQSTTVPDQDIVYSFIHKTIPTYSVRSSSMITGLITTVNASIRKFVLSCIIMQL